MSSLIDFEYRDTAFSRRMSTFAILNREHIDIREFLYDAYNYFEKEVGDLLKTHTIAKVSVVFSATFEKTIAPDMQNKRDDIEVDDDDDNLPCREKKEKQTLYIHTKSLIVDKQTDLNELFRDRIVSKILKSIDDAIMQGSGFTLSTINELEVKVNRHDPLRGSSYIKIPQYLSKKHAILNVDNADEMCFKWAILSAYIPRKIIHNDYVII